MRETPGNSLSRLGQYLVFVSVNASSRRPVNKHPTSEPSKEITQTSATNPSHPGPTSHRSPRLSLIPLSPPCSFEL